MRSDVQAAQLLTNADRSYGSVHLSPAYPEFSLQEFNRCVRDGPMVSIGEVEAHKPGSVPPMDLIAERAASMMVPILQHNLAQDWRQ
jgi:hypothetical protein